MSTKSCHSVWHLLLERCQGQWLHHHLGKPVLILQYSFWEQILPNIQPEPPLAQLEATPSHPINSYMGEKADPHFATTTLQMIVESNNVSPEPPLLQTEQSQFPQPLPIRLLLHCPSLVTHQHLNIFLVVRSTKLKDYLKWIWTSSPVNLQFTLIVHLSRSYFISLSVRKLWETVKYQLLSHHPQCQLFPPRRQSGWWSRFLEDTVTHNNPFPSSTKATWCSSETPLESSSDTRTSSQIVWILKKSPETTVFGSCIS